MTSGSHSKIIETYFNYHSQRITNVSKLPNAEQKVQHTGNLSSVTKRRRRRRQQQQQQQRLS